MKMPAIARRLVSARVSMRGSLWLLLACALLLPLPGQRAWAQPVAGPNPTPTIDRERVDRMEPVIPRAPRVAPVPAPPPPAVADQATAGAHAVALARLRYEGATLPRETLDAAARPFIGQRLTRETLQKIANAISGVYAKSNVAFYSVAIPRQAVSNGELVVQVTEGRIARYALRQETRSTPTRLIGAYVDRLMRDRPTHKNRLERTLSLLRDVPGQTVDAQLRTTARPDELLLDLGIKRKQVDVTLDINNNGITNVVTGVQAQLSVGINGMLREGDGTRVSANLPFRPDRYQFYSLSHTTPIGSNGTTLGLSGAYVRTRTSGTNILGEATQAGIALSHPLIRSYRRNLSLGLSLDGINSNNYYLDTAFGGYRTRVVRASATWSSIGNKGGYAVAGTVSQGLDGLGARAFQGYSVRGFTKANLQLIGVTELTKTTAVKVTVRGQYTGDKLPATERFSLGGEGAGRAFRIGELTADRAVAGSLELSWRVPGTNPARAREAAAKNAGGGLTIFAYADGALAHNVARPFYNLPAKDYSLASAGGGLRLGIAGWSATAQIVVPVKRAVSSFERKPRFLFGVSRTV